MCQYCFLPIISIDMDKHVQACHSNNQKNENNVNDEVIAGSLELVSRQSGLKCPFSCRGRWQNPESLEVHCRDSLHQHLKDLNRRVVGLEIMNKSARKKEIEENDMNVRMGGFKQPPSSLSLENNAKLLMGKTGSLQRNVIETASSLSSACAKKSNARFESEVQYLSDQSHTLESKHRAIVRSE